MAAAAAAVVAAVVVMVELQLRAKISVYWVKEHCGIKGNESADCAASAAVVVFALSPGENSLITRTIELRSFAFPPH